MIRGPTADARIKMERVIWISKSLFIDRSDLITPKAGATIEEETGDTNMKREFRIVIRHLFGFGQFLGLSGSFGPSQSTTYMSKLALAIEQNNNFICLPKNHFQVVRQDMALSSLPFLALERLLKAKYLLIP